MPRASRDEHMTLALLKQCRHAHLEQQCLCMLTVLDFKKNLAVFYICVPAESQGLTEILRTFEVSCRLPEVRYTVYTCFYVFQESPCNLHAFLRVFRPSEANLPNLPNCPTCPTCPTAQVPNFKLPTCSTCPTCPTAQLAQLDQLSKLPKWPTSSCPHAQLAQLVQLPNLPNCPS